MMSEELLFLDNHFTFINYFYQFPTPHDLQFNEFILKIITDLNTNDNALFYQQFENTDWFATGDNLFINIFNRNPSLSDISIQLDDLSYFDNLTNITSLYHYSVPNTKLCYPEPFIASASFMHSDLWFAHILIYQYWLWFVFIFLIIFFFLTFISVVRWCNMRVRPRRETRGVSRSKCGDLITACVPVSWAISIIVNESTDAIDFYDGFGTTELVVGIRAYQWGWEYYYPKDIDLNYNIKKNYSTFIGNSVKYNTSSYLNLKTNNLWKFYQNKTLDTSILPAHFLLFSIDNYKLLNFLNFNDLGANILHESAAFKKTKSFFKSFNANTFYSYSKLNIKYKSFSNLYFNDNTFFDSLSYGLKRHHNFLTLTSNNSSHSTFLNYKNFQKFLSYNCQNDNNLTFLNNKNSYYFYNKIKKQHSDLFNAYFNKIVYKNDFNLGTVFLPKVQNYYKLLSFFNNDADKKKIKYPIFKLFNLYNSKKNLNNFSSFVNANFMKEISYVRSNVFNNSNYGSKLHINFSVNQAIPTTNKHVRMFANILPAVSQPNYSQNSNVLNNYSSFLNVKISSNFLFFYNVSKSNWPDFNLFIKLASNKVYLDSPNFPVISSNPYLTPLNYDDCKNTFVEDIPTILQNKEDLLPNYVTSTYWNFYWGNNSLLTRLNNNFDYWKLSNFFYFPIFNFSYDYDFRNWQSIELLEDLFWEATTPLSTYEEYVNLSDDFYESEETEKHFNYSNEWKLSQYENKSIAVSFFNDFSKIPSYTNVVYLEDFFLNLSLANTNSFSIFPVINALINVDESYESLKFSNNVTNYNYKSYLNTNLNFIQPRSYFLIFNMFRSDYEDTNWYSDETNQSVFKNFELNLSLLKNSFKNFVLLSDNVNGTHSISNVNDDTNNIENDAIDNLTLTAANRFDNNINLRSTVKNSMVTYNALQKVFRSRLDEGRSNTKLLDFSNFYSKQTYLSSPRTSYEKILGKNKENFYKTNFYKTNFYKNFNVNYDLINSLNYYIYDFPFLLANKSDASRYLWFDWFSKWGFYEIQPSSSARYAIHGLPHFNKFFSFTSSQNEILNESESYLLRLSKARKNYLPNWTYTPYFYAKNNNWYKNNALFNNIQTVNNKLSLTKIILNDSLLYRFELQYKKNYNIFFLPTISNINSYTKTTWKPFDLMASYYFNMTSLLDILTKREFLYRQFLSNSKKIINLPEHAVNNPQNAIATEIKAMFSFVDPLICNNEYSRDLCYNSLNFFNFYVLKSLLLTQNPNFNNFIDLFYYYFFNNDSKNYLKTNMQLYKNQYRPLRKGINNMLRLHATGAVAMPIEIRLQILASSKDVIHSWAIPSAGIKIDCVPGYSSHKVMIFLVSGIFWGQCMEICGRYHHWMPIVVYFMKRDLFFLWCTHFVFSSNNGNWNINDRQYVDYVRLVSYDRNSWLSELLN